MFYPLSGTIPNSVEWRKPSNTEIEDARSLEVEAFVAKAETAVGIPVGTLSTKHGKTRIGDILVADVKKAVIYHLALNRGIKQADIAPSLRLSRPDMVGQLLRSAREYHRDQDRIFMDLLGKVAVL